MGMFDDYSPTDPNDQTQQYKAPSADPFAQFGIMTPMQKDQLAYARQVQQQQQQMQLQLQQQQLIHAQQQQSVDAASLASGYAFPTYLAMQAGKGVDNPMLTKGLSTLGGMAAQGMGATPRPGMQAPPMPPGVGGGGMMQGPPGSGLGGQPSQGMLAGQVPQDDRGLILSKAMDANPGDSGKAYIQAGNEILRAAMQSGNEEYMRSGTAMIAKGNELAQTKGNQDVTNKEKLSVVDKNESEVAKNAKDLRMATNVHSVNTLEGNTKLVWQDEKGDWKSGFEGTPITRTLDTTPAQKGKEVEEFQDLGDAVATSHAMVTKVKQNIASGAAVGNWAEAGVGLANNIIGTIRQIAPNTDIADDALTELNTMKAKGTFAGWAKTTAINESDLNDLTMSLAKTYAGPGGRVNVNEIKRAAQTIGEHIGDPATFAAVLDDVDKRTTEAYDRKYGSYKARLTSPSQIESMDKLHAYTHSLIDPATSSTPPAIADLLKLYPPKK